MLFLHDKLLEHEALCRRLAVLRRKHSVKPAGRSHFDEAVEVRSIHKNRCAARNV